MPNGATQDKTPRISGPGTTNPAHSPQITDHEMLRCIGSGSYGEVWLARNVMSTYRAVKVVYRQTFEHEHSYQREFTGIKKFEPVSRSHDGLVDILQVGRDDHAGYYYYVMELGDDQVLGNQIIPETYNPKTLGKEAAARGKLPVDECVKLGLSLAAALSHLHKHGLIHRDIKPSNIIFVNGIPKIADIGLVADLGSAQSFVGTPGFIPPEGPGTAKSDIYSLGKVLYEISTGKDRSNFPELPTLLGEAGDSGELLELNEVILKACESDVRKRYQSAEEMHADLLLLQAGKSVRRLRVLEQRFALATKIAVATAALVLIGIGAFYQAKRAERQANQRLAESYVGNGNRFIADGDLSRSLPWFTEALRLAGKDTHQNELQRIRLASVLRECPKTVQVIVGTNVLNSADISPNGRYLVTAGLDPAVTVWNAANGEPVHALIGHTAEVGYASFSPDSRFIVTASDDQTVRVWETETGREIRFLKHPDIVRSARFSPDGAWIVTACKDGKVRLWAVGSWTVKVIAEHKQGLRRAAFSPDSKFIVTASEDGTAQVWRVATGERVGEQLRHGSWVYDASFSPDSQRVVTASFDRTARVWNARTGMLIHTLNHNDNVRSAQFSPDGRYVVTACWDYMVRVWDISESKATPIGPPLKHTGPVVQAAFSAKGRRVMTASNDHVVRIWDLSGNIWLPSPAPLFCSGDGSRLVAVSNQVAQVRIAGTDNSVSLWASNVIENVILNHNGSRLVTLHSEMLPSGRVTAAQLWDCSSGKAISPRFVLDKVIPNASLSPDGNRIVIFSTNWAQTWTTTGQRLSPLIEHSHTVKSASFNLDGSRIVTASGTNVTVREADTGRVTWTQSHLAPVNYAEFSPDGLFVVSACTDDGPSPREARIWTASGKPVGKPLQHKDGVLHATFSSDSKFALTASEDRSAQVWVAATGKSHGKRMKHKNEVFEAFFSSDGHRILTTCRELMATQIWDAETREPLTPPLCNLARISRTERRHARFIANGRGIMVKEENTGESWIWMPDEKRVVEDLVSLAELISGIRIDSIQGEVPLTNEELGGIWQQLKGWPDFSTSREEELAWHEREAEAGENSENSNSWSAAIQWTAAIFHLRFLTEAEPENQTLRERLRRAQEELAAIPNLTMDEELPARLNPGVEMKK